MKNNIKLFTWAAFDIVLALVFRYLFELGYNALQSELGHTIAYSTFSTTFITIIAVIFWVAIVMRAEYVPSKLPWLIVLALEPFVGLFLFISFGRSYIRSFRYRKRPLSRPTKYLLKEPRTDFSKKEYLKIDSEITDIYKAAYNSTKHHAYLNDTSVQVLTNGEEKFPKLIEKLQKAKKFILMQYYIIKTDDTGIMIMDILKQKAKEGLEVYLIYDALGNVFLDKKYIRSLKDAKVKVIANEKVIFGLFNTKINYRNHRKSTIIDGQVAFTGGLNLADEYANKVNPFGYWRDTHLFIEGAAVKSLTQLFFRDYYANTGHFINDDRFYPVTTIQSKGLVQIVPSGPEYIHPPIRNMYVKMINNAKKSIKIMTPYIALDHELLTSLVIAAKSGVRIDIIIPGIPDKKAVYKITKSFIDDLLDEGINVHIYEKGFTHAKVFIIDDHLASCGTYNLDNRSGRINFEVTVLLYLQGVSKLVKDFDNDIKESNQINIMKWKKRGFFTRLLEGILNIFSPLV